MSDRAVVGWMDHGEVKGAFCMSLNALNTYSTVHQLLDAAPARLEHGPVLDLGRQELSQKFLMQTDAQWLLQIDADMQFMPDALERLLRTARQTPTLTDYPAIVSGLAYSYDIKRGQYPVMGRMIDGKPQIVFDWEDNKVIDVDIIGTSCLLTHRSVLEAFPLPFDRDIVLDDVRVGEDTAFSMHARAKGMKIVVDTGVLFEHVKLGFLTTESYQRQRVNRPAAEVVV